MQNRSTNPTTSNDIPVQQSVHHGLKPRPEQAADPQVQRRQEQAQQQVQQ